MWHVCEHLITRFVDIWVTMFVKRTFSWLISTVALPWAKTLTRAECLSDGFNKLLFEMWMNDLVAATKCSVNHLHLLLQAILYSTNWAEEQSSVKYILNRNGTDRWTTTVFWSVIGYSGPPMVVRVKIDNGATFNVNTTANIHRAIAGNTDFCLLDAYTPGTILVTTFVQRILLQWKSTTKRSFEQLSSSISPRK